MYDDPADYCEDELQEKCGIFGVFGKGTEAARLVHPGLWALQHRGQESSGIVSSNGKKLYLHKGLGLVAHVYDEEILDSLPGYIAIGHNRYSTSGGEHDSHMQPTVDSKGTIAVAHNGNLPITKALEDFCKKQKISIKGANDTELIHKALFYYYNKTGDITKAIKESYELFTGAFSLLVMTKDKLIGLRDKFGIRPLSLGHLNGYYVLSSETCALDTINAELIRDVKPGEMVVIDENGLSSSQIVKGEQKLDIFEFVYFARPDSILLGQRVNEVRRRLGIQLATEHPLDADVVIPVPDSAIPQALGYAAQSGIPFDHGLIKNRYIHRTFIQPSQSLREHSVQMKLNPIPDVLEGKRVIVIDDSIVRGTTSCKLVAMVREAGAKEVHLLSSSPPFLYPDFYGIDTPNQKDLIASQMTISEITQFTGADSVNYLSYEGLIKSTGLPENCFCTSCFTGIYPIDIGERKKEIDIF